MATKKKKEFLKDLLEGAKEAVRVVNPSKDTKLRRQTKNVKETNKVRGELGQKKIPIPSPGGRKKPSTFRKKQSPIKEGLRLPLGRKQSVQEERKTFNEDKT